MVYERPFFVNMSMEKTKFCLYQRTAMRLKINLWKSLTESAEDFVIYGACGSSNIVGRNCQGAITSHYYYLVTKLYTGYICYIYHTLIHTDVAGNRRQLAVYYYFCVFRVGTGITV